MTKAVDVVETAVRKIKPLDDLESDHMHDVLNWLDSGAPIFRISKPDNPPKHLVSYLYC